MSVNYHQKKFLFPENQKVSKSLIPKSFSFHVIILIFVYLPSIPSPELNWHGFHHPWLRAPHFYGIAPINVFNQQDLQMSENWFVLESTNQSELVPVLNYDGTRLSMHISDRIYFGGTLTYRRAAIDDKRCHFNDIKEMVERLSKIYLERKNISNGEYRFVYRQFYQQNPNQIKLEKIFMKHPQ